MWESVSSGHSSDLEIKNEEMKENVNFQSSNKMMGIYTLNMSFYSVLKH